MSIKASVKSLSTDKFKREFLVELNKKIEKDLSKILNRIKEKSREIVRKALRNSPEYIALLPGGRLYGELGVFGSTEILKNIVDAIVSGMEFEVIPFRISGDKVTGGVRVSCLRKDYSEVLGIDGISFESENGYRIDWLKWLLFEGSREVVSGYQYTINARTGYYSRTFTGIMIDAQSNFLYGVGTTGWGVPAEFAGTIQSNWLTRALKVPEKEIGELIVKEFSKLK